MASQRFPIKIVGAKVTGVNATIDALVGEETIKETVAAEILKVSARELPIRLRQIIQRAYDKTHLADRLKAIVGTKVGNVEV
jgi:hypothetical protein